MTTRNNNHALPLLSIGTASLLSAQFFSALADNAVLIIALAAVKARGTAGQAPFVQESFVLPFILLAPFTGYVADRFMKGHVMMLSNILKFSGAGFMAAGMNPVVAYLLVGIGAAFYSPAKYGILTQLYEPQVLVRANSLLEGSTVVAILLGVLFGGWLADQAAASAFSSVMIIYALAAGANLLIPRVHAEHAEEAFRFRGQVRRFTASFKTLFSDADARLSMLGTGIFWGIGITLRLLLFAWAPIALSRTDNRTPANLMGLVSVGIVAGAAIAGRWITLGTYHRALIGGVMLGPILLALSVVHDLRTAALLMAAIGFFGGIFVVPLNAVLQERGHRTVGSGNALAIQNFVENLGMLLFVGAYFTADAAGLSIRSSITCFGLIILFAVISIIARNRRNAAAI